MIRLLAVSLLLHTTCVLAAPPTVDDLHWMTGSWVGPMGEGILEETWGRPQAGTITAMVRMTSARGTEMLELIAINEEDDSLILRMQQFGADMQPRFPQPQALKLTATGESSATFEAHTPGGLQKLVYTREAEDGFSVAVTLKQGTQFKVEMAPQ